MKTFAQFRKALSDSCRRVQGRGTIGLRTMDPGDVCVRRGCGFTRASHQDPNLKEPCYKFLETRDGSGPLIPRMSQAETMVWALRWEFAFTNEEAGEWDADVDGTPEEFAARAVCALRGGSEVTPAHVEAFRKQAVGG